MTHHDELPAGLELARTTPPFDESTVPPGLLAAHQVAEGVWGRLLVHTGALTFRFEDEPDIPINVGIGQHVVIQPTRPHHLELHGSVTFRTLHEAHQEALRRSSVVLDQARELVANPSAIETESSDRLIEAQLSIAAAMERVTVSQLPDSDLVAKIAELVDAYDEKNQLDDRPYSDLVDTEHDGDAPFS